MRAAYFADGSAVWVRCWEEEVLGLALLRVELPRYRRGAARRLLRKVRRLGPVLNLPSLRSYPLWCPRPVETAPLYRAKAAELALWLLRRNAQAPERSVVGLRCRRWTAELERCAARLAPRVRGLALCLDTAEEEARAEQVLLQRFGLPVLHGEGDVCLCFAPAEAGARRLLLGTPWPVVEGVRWGWTGGTLPEQVPAAALLTLLVQRGTLSWEEVVLLEAG